MKFCQSKTVGAFEAKTHLSQLLDEVESGARIEITRRGKRVAVLQPPDDAENYPAALREVLSSVRERRGKYGITPDEIDAWKREGRA